MKGDFAVEFHDVVKIFPTPEGGQVHAVDHVSLNLRHGEFFLTRRANRLLMLERLR